MTELDLMNQVFDAMPVGVVLLDEHAKVVFYNRAEEQLAGRKRQDVIGQSFFDNVAPCTQVVGLGADYRARVADDALHKSLGFRFPRPFVDKPRDVHLRLDGLRINGRPYGLLLVEDVSAIRSVERTKDYLVRMLAHDMGNPLTVFTGALELLQRDDQDELWASARYASMRLRDMVVNLFDITRLQTADVPSRIARQDVVSILSASIAMAHGLADPRDIDLQLVSPPSLSMDCDADLLRRAIDNLLDNAIRHSPTNGRVTVRAVTEGDHILFQVQDDGPGVSPELQRAIFRAYTRGDTDEDGANHLGLGLAFVDLVAREHGGKVAVECPSTGGSVFTLRLPVETPQFEILPRGREDDVEPSD